METTKPATPASNEESETNVSSPREGERSSSASAKLRSGLTLRANFSWTFIGNAINEGSWWAMTVVLAKLGSPEHVGQFALGLAATAPVFMFATLRLRDIQATDAKQEYRFGDYFALRLITTTLALLIVAGIAFASGYSWETALVVLATGASKASEAISDGYYGLFMQHERLDRIAKSMMMKGPLSLVGLGIGFYLTGSVFWGVVGLTLARVVIMLAYDTRNAALSLQPSSRLGSKVLPQDLPRPHWDVRTLVRLTKVALPLGVVAMLISFYSNVPRYFIEGRFGSYQLGIFVAVAAFQKAAPAVIQALGRSASPRLAKYYAANNSRSFRKLALGVVGMGTLLGVAGVLVALVFGRQILTLFYGPEYALPGLFVLVMVAAGMDYVATMLLFVVTSARYFRVQLPLQILTTGAVALACFWLVPSAGLEGAAMALIIGQLVRVTGTLGAAWHAQRALHRQSARSEPQTAKLEGKPDMIRESLQSPQGVTSTATLVDSLLDRFNREEIVYSHWKSNIDLARSTAGRTDLDLLVDRKSWQQGLTILSHLGYKAAVARWGVDPPSIRHYYGLDPDSRQLVHVHLFSRVLTGESYVKSHLFPFEAMLLENACYSGQMRVCSKPAELVLFTLRMFIKYGSLLDLVSLWRKSKSLKTEVQWLQDGGDLSEALSLLRKHCPVIDESLFVKCVETLQGDGSLVGRLILAQRVRRQLRIYAKYTSFKRLLAYVQMLGAEVQRRLAAKGGNKALQAGGAVIAFVGADATGKSTLVAETGRWLGDTFAVRTIHTGKPPSSWLTAPINTALVLARRLASLRHGSHLAEQTSLSDSGPSRHRFKGLSSLPYAFRSVALAWDRQRLILKAKRLAAEGEIIICDRYPSRTIGAMDSPRLEEEPLKKSQAVTIYNRLARLEKRLYEQIPPPDIVLRLRVSLDTAKKRNRERNGQEGESYLEARHRQSQSWHMPGTRYVYDIDTEQSLKDTICNVKETIWGVL